jgi:hypothetical protein
MSGNVHGLWVGTAFRPQFPVVDILFGAQMSGMSRIRKAVA